MIKIAIVEDKEETLGYLKALLGGTKGFEVTGAYTTGNEALSGIEQRRPDVALVDLGLPDISGIEVIRTLKDLRTEIDIIAFTLYEDRKHLIAALKAGATGYILKGASAVELIQAIEAIIKGGSPMSPRIARYIVEDFQAAAPRKESALLTPREKETLEGIVKGLPEKKLAETLALSPHTVHTYIKSIYKKLHVNSKTLAIREARKKGIL